jgi:WD40 repeat protein
MSKRHGRIIGDALLNLDSKRLAALKTRFDAVAGRDGPDQGGLTCDEFVQLFLDEPFVDTYGKQRVVAALVFFFRQVDTDANGIMTWPEFVNNCIESSNASVMDERKQASNSVVYAEREIKYGADKMIIRDSAYRSSKLLYAASIEKFISLEIGAGVVSVMDTDMTIDYTVALSVDDEAMMRSLNYEERQRMAAEARPTDIDRARGIVDFVLVPLGTVKYLALAAIDGGVVFFDITRASKSMGQNRVDPMWICEIAFPMVATALYFVKSDHTAMLLCVPQSVDRSHTPRGVYLHTKDKALVPGKRFKMKGHKAKVTAILVNRDEVPIVTVAMDGNVLFWLTHEPRKKLFAKRGHKRGILAATLCSAGLFATVGFEFSICVWNYVQTSQSPIMRLDASRVHQHVITHIALTSLDSLVSVDKAGKYVRWNLSEKNAGNEVAQEFRSCSKIRELVESIAPLYNDQDSAKYGQDALPFFVVTDRRVRRFAPVPTWKRDVVRPVAIAYNPTFSEFAMAAGLGILVVCAGSGKLNRDFNPIEGVNKSITHMMFDSAFHRLILADQSGQLTIINYLNGSTQKQNRERDRQSNISSMRYVSADRMIVTSSWDCSVCIWDEGASTAHTIELVRRIKGAMRDDITCMDFSYHLSAIATATAHGEIVVWDFQTVLKQCQFEAEKATEITTLAFCTPYPILVSTDTLGCCCMWRLDSTGGSNNAFEKKHMPLSFFSHSPFVGVHAAILSSTIMHVQDQLLFYAGGEYGHISCWDLKPVITYCKVMPVGRSPTSLTSYNPRRHLFHGRDTPVTKRTRRAPGESHRRLHASILKNHAKTHKQNQVHLQRSSSLPSIQTAPSTRTNRKRVTVMIHAQAGKYRNTPRRPTVWAGHRNAVVLLESVYEPNGPYPHVIVSAGLDGSHRIWDRLGTMIGAVPFTNADMSAVVINSCPSGVRWGLPIDLEKQHDEDMRRANELLAVIKSKPSLEKPLRQEQRMRSALAPATPNTSSLRLTFLGSDSNLNERERLLAQMAGKVTWKLSPAEKTRMEIRERVEKEAHEKKMKKAGEKARRREQRAHAKKLQFRPGGLGSDSEEELEALAVDEEEDTAIALLLSLPPHHEGRTSDVAKFFPNYSHEKNRRSFTRKKRTP